MNRSRLLSSIVAINALVFVGCGSGKNDPVSKLAKDMIPITPEDYSICKYEVTQALWEAVMGENPSGFTGPELPVEWVSWDDCLDFIEKLNALPVVKKSGLTYNLPTADEWEYACGANSRSPIVLDYGYTNDVDAVSPTALGDVAWYSDNSDEKPHPVGKKVSNGFGLYDMLGNVQEWTLTFDHSAFDIDSVIACGGSWYSDASFCTAREREEYKPDDRRHYIGFRLAARDNKKIAAQREAAQKIEIPKLNANMVEVSGIGLSVCKYEVTQALWFAVMGNNPSRFKGFKNNPVEKVSWKDCQRFLDKLNALPEVKKSGLVYRLPTTEEWEYACRAGAIGNYCRLSDGTEITEETLGDVACYEANNLGGPDPVGMKKPNAFGLYDMHGNVWEWTSTGEDSYRVLCGGCWSNHKTSYCESSTRYKIKPDYKDHFCGFRLVRDLPKEREKETMSATPSIGKRRMPPRQANASLGDLAKRHGYVERHYASDHELFGSLLVQGLTDDSILQETMRKYRQAAEQGSTRSMLDLGLCYEFGIGVEKDELEAVEWYRKAAGQGDLQAQIRLGNSYNNGIGVDKDAAKAFEWYQKAAERDVAEAECRLGICYSNGKGVYKDQEEAAKWYAKAAEHGDAYALGALSICYSRGNGVEIDFDEAAKLFSKSLERYRQAAQSGDAGAQTHLGDLYKHGYLDWLEPNTAMSVEWYGKAAEQGYARAQYELGHMYSFFGSGVETDDSKAVEFYRKAAEQGHAAAQYQLGNYYKNGWDDVKADKAKAIEWYRKAAERGNDFAKEELEKLSDD